MKNIKNLKNTVVIKSKVLKLSNESSINNNSIKSKKMNPIALNLKNISSFKYTNNNNIKKINSSNYSKTKNHSLNSDTNQTSKKIRRNLILRGNNIFRTFNNHSNSDSYSITHNSSAKNFSETFRKFLLQNDDKKQIIKNYSRNRKKNSILGGVTNSYTYDTFQNENDKKDYPKINNNQFYFSPLTERNFDNNFSKIENRNHYLSRNKTSTPVKLFLTHNDSSYNNNNNNNNNESLIVSNSKIPLLNKNLFKKTFENNNIRSKKILKKPTVLKKLHKKNLSAHVLTSFKGFNNQINRKIRKAKSIFNYEENLNDIEEDNKEKLNYKSETEINNKSKIQEQIIIPEKHKIKINRKSVPEYDLGNQLAQLSNVNDTNLNRQNQKEGTLRKLGISTLFHKIENKNHFINLYNTSSETDSEESYNSNNSEKVKSVNLNKDNISSYFTSPIKLREKVINIPHEHLKKKMFENDIIDKLNEIDNKVFNKKINIIHNFQEKNYDLFCSYESNIKKLLDKTHQKDKTISEINILFVKKQIISHQNYESKYIKKLKKVRTHFKPINQHFVYTYLLEKYIPIDIYHEIYEMNSLKQINSKNYCINLFKNFGFFKTLIKTEIEEYKKIKPVRKKKTKHLNLFSKKNIFYMSRLCVYDYEYHIRGGVKKINHNNQNKKTINYSFNNLKSKQKTTKGRATIKVLLRKETIKHHNINLKETKEIVNKEKKEKLYLTRALKKINFYDKSIKILSKNKFKKYTLSKGEKEIRLEKKEISQSNNGFVNKYQMISRVTDLKMKMIENLESSETLFFHIKDRNYPLFKSIFEKFKMNPDLSDRDGNSLLSLAVQSNSFQIVNYLINAGASVNSQNKSNNTPLHFALSFHNFEIADMLIKSGANEKIQNRSGMTPWECLDAGVSII